jgi:glycosyltransferase involved in cell wall biosynthesis
MYASIIICTYNRANSLAKVLDSIDMMEVPNDMSWELVIVDNNSKDNTREIVDEFKSKTRLSIKYVVETKQGLSAARNCGISAKSGEIVIFTDDDVVVDKFWLSEVVGAFRKLDAACIGGKILPLWQHPPPKWLTKELHCYIALLDYGDEVLRMGRPMLWGANFAVRADVFDKYGVFSNELGRRPGKLYGLEETVLIDQLIKAGERVFYCPRAVVHHCIPGSRMKKSYFRKWRFHEGEQMALRSDESGQRKVFGVRNSMVRHLLGEVKHYLRIVAKRQDNAFIKQLNIISEIGCILQHIRRRGTSCRVM